MHSDDAVERFEELLERVGGGDLDAVALRQGEYGEVATLHARHALHLLAGDEQDMAYRYLRSAVVVAVAHLEGDVFADPFEDE